MTRKRKARPIVAATEQASGTAACSGAAMSFSNCSTASSKRQVVAEALLFGAENAVDGATLAAALGYRTLRELSREIQRERAAGHPICAAVAGDRRGYYLAATSDELSSYIRSLDRRIREVRRTRDACGETLRRMSGQEIMEGWNG